MNERALVLGATGAMATYLVPKLIEKGYVVDGVCFDDEKSTDERFTLIKHDAKET